MKIDTVYTPASSLRQPRKLISSMVRDLRASRELAWRLTVRDISAKYRLAFFGIAWSVFPPIVTTALFVMLNSQNILDSGEMEIPYPAYVMLGTIFWQLFSETLQAPLLMVTAARGLLSQINFPKEALLVSGVLQVLFNFVIKLSLVFVVFIWYQIPLPSTVLFVPLAILGMMLLGIALGLLLVPVGMLYADVSQALTIILMFLLFITPVGFQPPQEGILATITGMNPVVPILMLARDWMTTGAFTYFESAMWVIGICLLVLIFGWLLYRISMPIIVERLKA